jgi:hypothetical protein
MGLAQRKLRNYHTEEVDERLFRLLGIDPVSAYPKGH